MNQKTDRTRLRREHTRGDYDLQAIYSILDATPLCHIGFNDTFGTPAVIPTMQWREGNHIYWHASSKARSLRAMEGQPICLTVTLMDGFVMARSAMHHSMNYRSAMVYGTAHLVTENKEDRLRAMVEGLFPGRWDNLRPVTATELKATSVFHMEITEASAKMRGHGVGDDEGDLDWPIWSGIVPIRTSIGTPIDDEHNTSGVLMGDDIRAIKLG